MPDLVALEAVGDWWFVDALQRAWDDGDAVFPLDPRLPPDKRERGDFTMGRMLIDATKPFHWREKFALANKFSADKREEIWEKWAPKLGLK